MVASKYVWWAGCVSLFVLFHVSMQGANGAQDVPQGLNQTNDEFVVEVPLNHDVVKLRDALLRKELSVPVVLKQTGRFVKGPVRYQLRKKDGSSGVVCELSLPQGGVGWKVFSQGAGTNYLAWVSRSDVGIMQIPETKESREKKPLALRLFEFLPRENLLSTISKSSIHSDTEILQVEKGGNGLLNVKVKDPVNDQVFRFTFDGKTWRCHDSSGTEIPSKWK